MVLRIVYAGSRRLPHFFVRMGYLSVLVGLVILTLLTGGAMEGSVAMSELAKAGSGVFAVIAYGQVIGVCLLAPLFMAGAIASEQSGRTYNILLTTPMTNLQIVLGSLAGRLFFILALLCSGIPLFAVLLVFGGVRVSSIFEAFAVAAATAVFVGSVAVTLSVLRAGGRKAVFAFVIAIAAYLVGAYALDVVLVRRLDPRPYTTWLTPLHPILVLESSITGTSYGPPPAELLANRPALVAWYLGRPFEVFMTWTLGGSALLIVGCSLFLRRMGQGAGAMPPWLLRVLRLQVGERTRPHRRVTGNPVAWREAHTRGKVASGIVARWGFLAVAVVAASVLIAMFHAQRLPELPTLGGGAVDKRVAQVQTYHALLTALLVLEVAVVSLVAIYMSAGSVSREREDGTLDIMLTTPVTQRQYIWGKLRGLVRFLGVLIAAPVGTLLLAGAYGLFAWNAGWDTGVYPYRWMNGGNNYGSAGASMSTSAWVVLPEAGVLLAVMLVPFVSLCVAAGMGWSLKAKSVLGAVVPTVAILGALSLVLGLCGVSASSNITLIGPVINAFSPATGVMMLVSPYAQVAGFAESIALGRLSLWLGAVLAAGGYGMVVYALIATMVKGFDQTVRKLSGTG